MLRFNHSRPVVRVKAAIRPRNLSHRKRGHPKTYLIPKIFPTLLRRPAFVVGIPVALAILRFAFVMPKARFQLKDRPGILKELFLAIKSLFLNVFNFFNQFICKPSSVFKAFVRHIRPVFFNNSQYAFCFAHSPS